MSGTRKVQKLLFISTYIVFRKIRFEIWSQKIKTNSQKNNGKEKREINICSTFILSKLLILCTNPDTERKLVYKRRVTYQNCLVTVKTFQNLPSKQSRRQDFEKLFLQRYGEQSVRWQLCAPYRCKNKCLGGVCFYSDMEHKSNNMIKNDKIATQLWSFKFWLGICQRWWNWHVHRYQFWWIFRLFLYIKIHKIMSNCCKLDDLKNIGLRNPNFEKQQTPSIY